MIQRMAIRRMYESLPKLGIEFAAGRPIGLAAFGTPLPTAAATRVAPH